MAERSKTKKAKDMANKLGAVILALVCLSICAGLFLMFWRSEVFPREVQLLFLACDSLMGIAILWLLQHYLVYYDGKDS